MRDQRSPRIPLNDRSSGIAGGNALTEMDGDTVANPLNGYGIDQLMEGIID